MKNLQTFAEFINESILNEAKAYKLKYDYQYGNETLRTHSRTLDGNAGTEVEKLFNKEWGTIYDICFMRSNWDPKMTKDREWAISNFEPGKTINLSNGIQIIFHKDPSIKIAKTPNWTFTGYNGKILEPEEFYLYLNE